jgi:hypothetical protein
MSTGEPAAAAAPAVLERAGGRVRLARIANDPQVLAEVTTIVKDISRLVRAD